MGNEIGIMIMIINELKIWINVFFWWNDETDLYDLSEVTDHQNFKVEFFGQLLEL